MLSDEDLNGDDLKTPAPPRADAGADARAPRAEVDAAPDDARADAAVEASSATQTFTVGANDCNTGHCNGGYDGVKDTAKHLATATKQCEVHAFARAVDFTIGGQPGGRFCDWNGTAYGCDSSCDGCNVMTSVTCTTP